ncbi:hypothetical protein OS493_025067 [Desmophyllum pertusum]|uniref:Uncharacterized protein n=1 Tax=Desmophyllum pertusum TaxID=174260 RepID=A0A9X0CFA0_9CNID|nr:hypothetical protein OS493_025067 [Desmophyllum pertusum]
MEVAGKLSSHGESCDKADRFYEQALLLVDCCKIPEAIKLLEKAIQLKPDSEIYKETLAFFQMNTQYYSDHLKERSTRIKLC